MLERLRQGLRVAYVSDAGTPAISDPGARLVADARQAGLPVLPLPGASSITTVLSVAGLTAGCAAPGWFCLCRIFAQQERRAQHRGASAGRLRRGPWCCWKRRTASRPWPRPWPCLGTRPVTVGRELTKQFEEIATLAAQDFPAWLAQDGNRLRGEFALVLHPAPASLASGPDTRVLSCCWPSCRSKPPSNWPPRSPASHAMRSTNWPWA